MKRTKEEKRRNCVNVFLRPASLFALHDLACHVVRAAAPIGCERAEPVTCPAHSSRNAPCSLLSALPLDLREVE